MSKTSVSGGDVILGAADSVVLRLKKDTFSGDPVIQVTDDEGYCLIIHGLSEIQREMLRDFLF